MQRRLFLLLAIAAILFLGLIPASREQEPLYAFPRTYSSDPIPMKVGYRTFLSPTRTPTATPTPTPTPTPTATPTPTPTPLYDEEMPSGIYPHLQCLPSTPVPALRAVKVFSCEQAKLWPDDTFVVLRLYNTEGMLLDPEIPEQEVANSWLKTLDSAIKGCEEYIDAVEVFNEVCGDGDLEKSRRVARVTYLIVQDLVKRRIRPIVLNYPVSAPSRQEVALPEVQKLINYVNSVNGYIGVHVYFPCHQPDFWGTWIFADSFRGVPARFVATESGICFFNHSEHQGWDPYRGWKDCGTMTEKDYWKEVSRLPEIARRKGINLQTFFLFTVSLPHQGWGGFQSGSLFGINCTQ